MRNPIPYILSVLLAIAVAACGSDASDAAQQDADSTTLHVAIIPTLDCLPVYYAQQTGIYDSLGLELKLHTYMSQADADTALREHHVSVAYSDLARAILLQQSATTSVQAVARLQGRLTLLADTSGDRRVLRLQELQGRLVAVARYGITDYWSDRVDDSAGLSQADIFRPNVGDVRTRTEMLCNGSMETALLPEPYATEAALRGKQTLMTNDSIGPALSAFVAETVSLRDSLFCTRLRTFLQGYDIAATRLQSLPSSPAATTDSVAQLLHEQYGIADTLAASICQRMPAVAPTAKLRQSDADSALLWLRRRDADRAQYRLIRPAYTTRNLFWHNGL